MKNIYTIVTLLLFSINLISCSKDEEDVIKTSIEGNYKFMGVEADLNTKLYTGLSQSSETKINYITKNNSGTVSIEKSKLFTSNVSYNVTAEISSKLFLNGELLSTTTTPYIVTVPPSTSSTDIELIGADSIYFKNGLVLMSNQSYAAQPGGAKYKIEGNLLNITMSIPDTLYHVDNKSYGQTKGYIKLKLQRQ